MFAREGRRVGNGGLLMDTAFLFGMMKIFLKDRVVRVGQIWECTKNNGPVHFRRANFMVCGLYLNLEKVKEGKKRLLYSLNSFTCCGQFSH